MTAARKSKTIIVALILIVLCLLAYGVLTNRFDPAKAHRWPENNDTSSCVLERKDGAKAYTSVSEYPDDCPVQAHHFIIDRGNESPTRVDYELAFLEFDDHGNIISDLQRQAVLASLNRRPSIPSEIKVAAETLPRERFLIFFVHGWRNNASADTLDPKRFQVALAYFASFIAQRCEGSCVPVVTGVFIGWPGAVINEQGASWKSEKLKAWSEEALSWAVGPTFGPVFRTSNLIGPTVVSEIKRLIDDVRVLELENDLPTRVLVLGHSAGSNLLMAGLSGTPEDTSYGAGYDAIHEDSVLGKALAGHEDDAVMDPVLGDLAVLFAPASPASRWVALQQRQLTGAGACDVDPCRTQGCGFKRYPDRQRPALISITSACAPGLEVGCGSEVVHCDKAVYQAFHFHQGLSDPTRFLRHRAGLQERRAIGFYASEGRTARCQPAYFGVSHVATDNSNARRQGTKTAFKSLTSKLENSICVRAGPWLEGARVVSSPRWDLTGSVSGNRAKLSSESRRSRFAQLFEDEKEALDFGAVDGKGTRIQWIFSANGVPSAGKTPRRAMTDSNTPFWNTIAHSTVMQDHGGFYSYPLLCSLTQLWLDPVVRQAAP